MKKRTTSTFLFTLLAFSILIVSCEKGAVKEQETDEISYTIEVVDSVMVDFVGSWSWSSISPDGKHFLAINTQTNEIILIDQKGSILQTFQKTGDQPESIGNMPLVRPQFKSNTAWSVLGSNGIFTYDLSGEQIETIKPDFNTMSNLVVLNSDYLQFKDDQTAVMAYGNRDREGAGFYSDPNSTYLEYFGFGTKAFEAIVPFPQESKFAKDQAYTILLATPSFRVSPTGLFVAFKNEPKVFFYDWKDLKNPSHTIPLSIADFQEAEGKDLKSVDPYSIQLDTRDFTFGSIDDIFWKDGRLIIQFRKGLSEDTYANITAETKDFSEILQKAAEKNKSTTAVANEDGSLIPITIPSNFGNIVFVDHQGFLWITPNKSEYERDYEVLFKTRIEKLRN